MSLLLTEFDGLAQEDFAVYRRECWSSNIHNLQRMKTKERVVTLAKRAADGLEAELALEASSEIPSVWNGREVADQWAYLLRTPDARKTLQPVLAKRLDLATRVKDPAEHHRHAILYLRLSEEAIEVGLRLNEHATIDLQNLVGRTDGAPLAAALKALPDEIRLDGEAPQLDALVAAARAARAGEREWVALAREIPTAAALDLGADLVGVAAEVWRALVPLYRLVSWTPDNDNVGVSEEIEALAEEREEAARARAEADQAAEKAREEREATARAATAAKQAEQDLWKEMQQRARRLAPPREEAPPPREKKLPERAPRTAPRDEAAAPPRPPRKAPPKREAPPRREAPARQERSEDRAPRAAAPAPTPAANVEVGATVRLGRGLLAGKEGIVSGRAGDLYKVKVGALEVKVGAADLEPLG